MNSIDYDCAYVINIVFQIFFQANDPWMVATLILITV